MKSAISLDIFTHKNIIYLIAFLSFAYSLIGFRFGFNTYDEGLITYGAMRVLNRDVPYRDFWIGYGPGQFWLVAGLFKLFGSYLLVEHIYSVTIHSLISLAVYLIAQRLILSWLALVPWFLTLLWINTYSFASPMPPALLFSLFSALFILYFLAEKLKKYLFISGLMVGVSLLFRHDIGLYTIISEGTVICLFIFFSFLPRKMSLWQKLKPTLKSIAYYLFGVGIIVVPVTIYLLKTVSVTNLINDLFIFSLKVYPKVTFTRFPAILPNPAYLFCGTLAINVYLYQVLLRLIYYFPLIMYASAIIIIILELRKGINILPLKIWGLILFTLLGIMLLGQGFIHAHHHFLRHTFIPSFLVLIFLMQMFSRNRLIRLAFIILILVMTVIPLSNKAMVMLRRSSYPFSFDIERAKGIYWDREGVDYQNLVKYIQKNVPENERIFVWNNANDCVLCYNLNIMVYFLTNRLSATKYHDALPAFIDAKTVQEAIIFDIEKHKVRYIVQPGMLVKCRHGKSSRVTTPILNDFIRKKFKPVQQFIYYAVWKRQ